MLRPEIDQNKPESGMVQIAIWKDNPHLSHAREMLILGNGAEVFYDFAKPLRLLGSPGWPSVVQAESQEGFFVFSVYDSSYFY